MANNYYDGNQDYSYDSYAQKTTGEKKSVGVSQSAFVGRTFGYMTVGLVLTFLTALFASEFFFEIFSNLGLMIFLLVAQIGCTLVFSLTINKASYATTLVLFVLNALLLGVSLSSIFIVYELGDIYLAFAISAVLFLAMALIGTFARVDFSKISALLLACCVGMLVAGIIGFFVGGVFLSIVCVLGIILFMGVTIVDVARMRGFYAQGLANGRLKQYGMYCAFQLYLDFINIFLRVLRLVAQYSNKK